MMNALLAYRMDESYTTASQGYVALVSGDLSLAEAMLNKAVQNTRHRTLAMYDLAIMRLMQDNTDVAESLLMTVLAQDDIERDAPYVRLLIARVDGAAFTFEERTNVSLSESCAESLSAITRRRGHASESAC
jgi:Tfp pilus assembly protein PilF